MSASLVGSEMCIRDSTSPRAPSRHSNNWGRSALTLLGLDSMPCRSGGPVSYTHLTLPTICSV
eukprot:12921570-Alexandrium_andersonii.AAC.1